MSGSVVKVKSAKVTNSNNVIIQIPKFIVTAWELEDGDEIEMYVLRDGNLVLMPKRKEASLEEKVEKVGEL